MRDYRDLSDEEKKVVKMLSDPEVQKEIIERLTLKFTPEVIEEMRKIEQRHAELWPYVSQIVYMNNQESEKISRGLYGAGYDYLPIRE